MDLAALRARVASLTAYRTRPRPAAADSYPVYVADELRRIDTMARELVQVAKDLDARLTDLETP